MMQTVVTAPDTIAALGKLTATLGPDAVLVATRRTAHGIEMTGRAVPPTPAETARSRFLAQATRLGFDRSALETVLTEIPVEGDTADLWVRFVAGLERRLTFDTPVLDGHLAVIGAPGSGRTTALVQLHKRAGLPVALVEGDAVRAKDGRLDRAAALASVPYLVPSKGGIDALIARQGRKYRLLVDLPDDDQRPRGDMAALLCVPRGAEVVPPLGMSAGAAGVIVTRFDSPGPPGALLSALLALDLPVAFLSRSQYADGAFEAARAVPLCRLVVTALSALGSPS
jgi:hypothetical protein